MIDVISGYTYVDRRMVPDNYIVFAFNGKTYRQKTNNDGYGLFLKVNKLNARLRRQVKKSGQENLILTTITGKNAFDKYGFVGMNGVLEISAKK